MNNKSACPLTHKRYAWKLPFLVLLVSTGCSDPTSVSKDNFGKAAQTFLDTQYPQCFFTLDLPGKVDDTDVEQDAIMHALANVGAIKETGLYRKQMRVSPAQPAVHDVTTYYFQLGSAGQPYYTREAKQSSSGKWQGGFCFGRARVEQVHSFTVPVESMGVTRSTVRFSYSVTDIPDWAKASALVALNNSLMLIVASEKHPFEEEAVFVRTDSGWAHQGLVK
ncbi:hypothetical protein ACMV5I_28635 [Serratia sp. T13T92]|uniref:hypothetical protein n=1 Tax=Serratia sp. T13T92 TaxID=3397496 RepID=UPI0039E0478E